VEDEGGSSVVDVDGGGLVDELLPPNRGVGAGGAGDDDGDVVVGEAGSFPRITVPTGMVNTDELSPPPPPPLLLQQPKLQQ
jgi:hypothetical protein